MKSTLSREAIYPKDVVLIVGVADRTARRIVQKIKEKHQKAKWMFVTIAEFCRYAGLDEAEVRRLLRS